ncbi:M1 family metallopeptidase [Paenibacillus brevis]|uniref:M1 family metallopeptidase n=1 Tax=Paenibacillus brevis TaxID=2841508 RepID=A0ABS6FXR9_9BACL|nr:M1 family metallopeptidase [Paenibacillus brevis]MBU5674282.1 M1 family metallopeptidase [Paenibacillus brevis]
MTRRTTILGLSILAICLIVGTLRYSLASPPGEETSYASEQVKPLAAAETLANADSGSSNKPVPSAAESIQQPTAEVLSYRVTEYHIQVKLDEQNHVLTGTQTVTWTHPGKKAVNELYFHLYPNAFASADTTFMKESGGKLRGDVMPKDGWGGMELTEIRTTDGISLLHRIQFVQPDDGNANDQTLAKVRLPVTVRGGESITLKIQFKVELPKIFARMGAAGDFVMAGQWFPKLSVYEPAGTRGRTAEGWNLHQYHGNSEFYSDFGIYSVNIDVPDHYTVAATGFQTKPAIRKDGRKSIQFYADDVHDFAWSASPDFVYVEEPFSSSEVPGVRIKLYLDPKHEDLKERYFYAAKVALANFSKWYGRYPYSTLSIVVPPEEGNGAGGMEYPTLITAFGASGDSPSYDELERTVIHEIGHQFFYGMVASNEFEEAWLDEAFTSYAEDKLMEQEFGIQANLPVQSAIITSPVSLTEVAWKYGSGDNYAKNVYYRGKLVLLDIERQVGTKTMKRIMYSYSTKYRFKHPTTADFERIVEQTTGRSWKSYFKQYVYNGGMADFAVEDIQVREITSKEGTPLYESVVTLRQLGGDASKVPLLFSFKDGHTEKKVWNGEGERIELKLQYKEPIDFVQIDPDYSLVLENKHINNYLKNEIQEPVETRTTLGAVKLLESLLGLLVW